MDCNAKQTVVALIAGIACVLCVAIMETSRYNRELLTNQRQQQVNTTCLERIVKDLTDSNDRLLDRMGSTRASEMPHFIELQKLRNEQSKELIQFIERNPNISQPLSKAFKIDLEALPPK